VLSGSAGNESVSGHAGGNTLGVPAIRHISATRASARECQEQPLDQFSILALSVLSDAAAIGLITAFATNILFQDLFFDSAAMKSLYV
jgi:hypothetical protein